MNAHRFDWRAELNTPLKPAVFLLLLALAEEERHGYALAKSVRELSNGSVRLATGPLYRHLARLLERGWVAECKRRPPAAEDDPRRRYYRLTPAGRRAAALEAQRLESLVAVSSRLALIEQRGTR